MKRLLINLLLMVVLATFSVSCKKDKDPEVVNILENSTFSEGLNGWIVETLFGASAAAYTDNGNACMKITRPLPTSTSWVAFGQEVRSKMTVGKKYKFSLKYKVLSGANVKLILRLSTTQLALAGECITNDDCIQLLTADNSWHTISFSYTESNATSATERPNLGIYSDYNCSTAEAEFLIDDVTMVEE